MKSNTNLFSLTCPVDRFIGPEDWENLNGPFRTGKDQAKVRKHPQAPESDTDGDEVCSYWERQECRHADESGFGCNPWSIMSPEACDDALDEYNQEDEKDPPCGNCPGCDYATAGPDEREPFCDS